MNAKIQFAALLLPAILIVGCSKPAEPVAADAQAVAAQVQAPAKHLKKALPKGVEPSFAYNLRRDRIARNAAGKSKRYVQLEYLDMDQQQALAAITADLTAAGYKAGKSKPVKNDGVRVVFRQARQPTIRVTVRAGGKLQHPSARGRIYLSMPSKAAAAKPATAPSPAKAG